MAAGMTVMTADERRLEEQRRKSRRRPGSYATQVNWSGMSQDEKAQQIGGQFNQGGDGNGFGARVTGLFRRYVEGVERVVDSFRGSGAPDAEGLGMDPDSSGGRAYDLRQGFNSGSVKGLLEDLRYNLTGEAPVKPGDTDGDNGRQFGGVPERALEGLARQFNDHPVLPYVLAKAKEDDLPGADSFAEQLLRSQDYSQSSSADTIRPSQVTRAAEWAQGGSVANGGDRAARQLYQTLTGKSTYSGGDGENGMMSDEAVRDWARRYLIPDESEGNTVMTGQ